MNLGIILSLLLASVVSLHCTNVERIKKNFEDTVTSLRNYADCNVTVSHEKNGCLLKVITDNCPVPPSLRLLQKSLFPQVEFKKISGGFLQENKLHVESYTANLCDPRKPFFEAYLSSEEPYDLVETYLVVTELNFKIKFSFLSGFVRTLSDLVITEGNAVININKEELPVSFESQKGKKELNFEFFIDELSLQNAFKKFQLNSLEDVFDQDIISVDKLTLKTFKFHNVTVTGIYTPSEAFEFQITGRVNGSELLNNASKVLFILQHNKTEVVGVKALLFSVLENQTATTLNENPLLQNYVPNIPLFTVVDNKIALTISNGDFITFKNDEIKKVSNVFVGDIVSGKIVNKGIRIIYRLKHLQQSKASFTDKTEGTTKSFYPNATFQSFLMQQQQVELQNNVSQIQQLPPWNSYQLPLQQQQQQPKSFFFEEREERSIDEEEENEVAEVGESMDETDVESGFGVAEKQPSVSQQAKYLIFEMEVQTDVILILPKQSIEASFNKLMDYILGSKSKGKESIPIHDGTDVVLDNIVLLRNADSVDVNVGVLLSKTVIVVEHIVELTGIVFDVTCTVGNNTKWSISIGNSKGKDNSPEVILLNENQKYFLSGEVEIFSQDEFVHQLGISPLSDDCRESFPELTTFPYKNVTFKMELKKEGALYAKLFAKAVIFDHKSAPVENIIQKGSQGVISGIFFKRIDLNDFLFELYKKRMLKICWLSMKDVVIVSSSKNDLVVDDMFTNVLNNMRTSTNDAISITGKLVVDLKTGCLDEPLCNFIKNHITHQLSLSVEGEIQPLSYLMSARLIDVSAPLGDVWGINQLELRIKGTSEKYSGVLLSGQIIHRVTHLVGKIFVGEDKDSGRSVIRIFFEEPWQSFLGYPMVTLKDLISETDISGDEKLHYIGFSARVEIGDTTTPLIMDNATVMIDLDARHSEGNDVVYGKVNNASINILESSFQGSAIHPLLQNVVFNEKIYVCFTNNNKGYTVPEFGNYKFTPTNHAFSNIQTIFGNVSAELRLNEHPTIFFQTERLNFVDDKLILQENKKKKKEGAKFMFPLTEKNNNTVMCKLKAYMKTFGHEEPIDISLVDSNFNYQFSSYLFDEVKMQVNISGSMDVLMNDTTFKAMMDNIRSTEQVTSAIKKHIKNDVKSAERVINKCEVLINNINELRSEIIKEKEEYVLSNLEKRNDIFKKRLEIESANQVIKKDCAGSCGRKCITALDWDHDCSNVRGQKFGCLKWKECQTHAADTTCIAKCEANKIPASINAHQKRDDIRYLAEDISKMKKEVAAKDKYIEQINKIDAVAKRKLVSIKERLKFVLKFDVDRKDLFAFTDSIPVSESKLVDIKVPCLTFQKIVYKFLGEINEIKNEEICMKGKFYRNFACAVIEGADKRFRSLFELIDQLGAEIVDVDVLFDEFKDKYNKHMEQDDTNEENNQSSDVKKEENGVKHLSKENFFFFFNDTDKEDDVFDFLHLKRSEIEDHDKDILDATEAEISQYVLKGAKTSAAFEREAPWIYMKKKRGITIAALGMLQLHNSSVDDHCVRRKHTIEHFEDLMGSLKDVKYFYEMGKHSLEKTKRDLLMGIKDIEKYILQAKSLVPSAAERDDMIYWLNKNNAGIKDYIDSAYKQLEHQNTVGLKYWTTQLHSAERSSIAHAPSSYFEQLKSYMLDSLVEKRSKIEGQEPLDAAIKELINISQKEPLLSDLDDRLSKLSQDINRFKHSSSLCDIDRTN